MSDTITGYGGSTAADLGSDVGPQSHASSTVDNWRQILVDNGLSSGACGNNGCGDLDQASNFNYHSVPSPATNGVTNVRFDPVSAVEFATPQEAATHAIEAINARFVAENREYTGKIRLNPLTGMYYATPPIPGSETGAALTFNRENDQLTVGDYHTHGNYFGYDTKGNPVVGSRYYDTLSGTDSENFSPADRRGADALAAFLGKLKYFLWLGTPSGAVKQYSTATGETTTLKPGN